MSPESWQIACPRCGWANSGAVRRCMKCGQPLRTSPGLLVAGQSAGSVIAPPTTAPKRVVQAGGFFPRLIALIIDGLILGVIIVPIVYLWAAQQSSHLTSSQGNLGTDVFRSVAGPAVAQYSADQLGQLMALLAGLQILALFYYVGTWSILGGSPGQLLMSLRIVDGDARTIGFGRALLRYVIKGLFGILAPVSALMVAFGKDKRAIHDLLAGTYVIQFLDPTAADLPPAQPAPPEAMPPPTPPAPAPAPPPVPEYTGAAVAAAAVSGEAPPPSAFENPPAYPPGPPAPAAPQPESAASAFGSYSPPQADPPSQPPPPPSPPSPPGPPEGAPASTEVAPGPVEGVPAPPEIAPENPPPADTAGLPVFPPAQPGELQPMAARPAEPLSQTARPPAPASEDQPPPAPYAAPFAPAAPPPSPPEPPPSPAPED